MRVEHSHKRATSQPRASNKPAASKEPVSIKSGTLPSTQAFWDTPKGRPDLDCDEQNASLSHNRPLRHQRGYDTSDAQNVKFCSRGRRHGRGHDTSEAQNVVLSHISFAWTSTSTRSEAQKILLSHILLACTSTSTRMRHLGSTTHCSQPHSVRPDVDVDEDATPRMHRTFFSATFCSPGRRPR